MCDVGDLIDGRYRVERSVGSGGMGIVYLTTDLQTSCAVAVKVLRTSVDPSLEVRARLQREIELLSRLRSPHVAAFLAAGYLDDGLPYFVMEFLEGRDLKAELRRRGPLPYGEAAAYVIHACRGIAVAHHLGIVHRDLKPHNLIATGLDGLRTVKIVDFGVAKSLDATDPGLTATDTAVGTPLYMSPEQLIDARAISTKADVWALGVILYELLAGFSPFADDSPGAVIAAVTLDEPVPILKLRPDVPDGIAKAIDAALVKQPSRRIGTAEELAGLLSTYATPDHLLIVPELSEQQPRTGIARPPRTRVSAFLRDQILASFEAEAPQERVTIRSLPTASTHGSRPQVERVSLVPKLRSLAVEAPTVAGIPATDAATLTLGSRQPSGNSGLRWTVALVALTAAAAAVLFWQRQRSQLLTRPELGQGTLSALPAPSATATQIPNVGALDPDSVPTATRLAATVGVRSSESSGAAASRSIDSESPAPRKQNRIPSLGAAAWSTAPATSTQTTTAKRVPKHL